MFDISDALTIAGLGALAYGLHAVYPPAAWIVTGAILLLVGLAGGGER